MRNHLDDVVSRALEVLDEYGLADVSMRRIATELGVQPSALYHHVASKQQLLALMADEILARGRWNTATPPEAGWSRTLLDACRRLRDSMLAYRDGAELVATAHSFGIGSTDLIGELAAPLLLAGCEHHTALTGARTLLHVTFGHVSDEQTHLQASSAGAVDGPPRGNGAGFDDSIALVIDGLRTQVTEKAAHAH